MFDLIAFDADDTLWHNENHYYEARERFRELMSKYEVIAPIDDVADHYEVGNIKYYGYGVMSFILSLIESAIELTAGTVRNEEIRALLDLGKEMLTLEVSVFDGVEETLDRLSRDYTLMLITKGDLAHQQSKVRNSGLVQYFRYVEVVSDKTCDTYAEILERHGVHPSHFLMVGNSLRSDILPVAELGGWAVHVPSARVWAHEVVELSGNFDGRVFEVAQLQEVPALVNMLAEKGLP